MRAQSRTVYLKIQLITIYVYLKESWERKGGSLVWNSKYSTSPESPLGPMSLNPYWKGWSTGRADSFSWTGLAKKLIDSCSIFEMVVWLTPWLTTLKKPRVSQALIICIDTRDLSCDMSIIGISLSTATICWIPFTILREREGEREREKLYERWWWGTDWCMYVWK